MPKLIVYVKADVWRRVEAGYGEGAANVMRDVSVRAIEELLEEKGEELIVHDGANREVTRVTVPPPDDHFKPDFKGVGQRGHNPGPAAREPRCPADTPKGTRCKLCGQVHK